MRLIRKLVNGMVSVFTVLMLATVVIFAILGVMKCTPYIVLSGSMSPFIQTGSLCVVDTKVPFEEIKPGDVIAFETGNGQLVTHRAVAMKDGLIETKGDANAVTDGFSTSEANYRGKTLCSIPYLGYALSWIQTMSGKILTVTGVVMLALLSLLLDEKEKEQKLLKETNRRT